MDDVNEGPSSTTVMEYGVMADDALDMFVDGQVRYPTNFKDLTEILMTGGVTCDEHREFFLAITLATAIIRLAAEKGAGL